MSQTLRSASYADRTPKSRELFERAKKVEPAGVSYKNRYFDPYPFFVKSSKGAKLTDLDGNVYTDYWCTHMAMILGHAHPAVTEAIKRQAENGWHHGFVHELEVEHSETIVRNVPSAEMVRHTSSGSEANFFATRLARTFTKRSKVVKFEGGWQGSYDPLHLAIKPPFDKAVSGGMTHGSQEDTIVAPFNDFDAFQNRVKGEKLACVVLEPILFAGGCISADREFVKALREYCDDTHTLLVFDEIITGFRIGLHGAQGYYGIEPDITVLGKIIGGGLPIGAICGRQEVMERMDHRKYSGSDYAYHGNTFAGNAITLAAGLAAIRELERSSVYDHIDRLGEMARDGIREGFAKSGFPAQILGLGSMFSIHMTTKTPIKDISGYANYNHQQTKKLFHHLLENEIVMLLPEILHGGVTYAHSEEDVKYLVKTVSEFAELAK
ncbi:MAG TPA: aspartate aminotransferase family protein [Terriglobales bacterium]|nr:aspartate aminotransferase family protein [Terriglobales bacterium]